jgi:hypothetical protein
MTSRAKDSKMIDLEIEVREAEFGNWFETEILIKIEDWMDSQDITSQITERAMAYCSRNGLNYETWDMDEDQLAEYL